MQKQEAANDQNDTEDMEPITSTADQEAVMLKTLERIFVTTKL